MPLRAEAAELPESLPEALRVVADSLLALSRGPGGGGQWGDPSDATREAFRSRQDRLSTMRGAIPRTSLASDEDRLLYDNVLEVVEGSRASRGCRSHLWYAPSMFAGWHLAAANWGRITSVGHEAGRSRTLQALRELPEAIEAERALLARGLDSGFTSSAQVITVVVRQFRELAPLVASITGATDLSDGIRLLKTDARFTYPSRDPTLAAYRAMTGAGPPPSS